MRCDECRFWDAIPIVGNAKPHGWCHRNAPVFVEYQNGKTWPETTADDWCGEFQPQTKETP